MRYSARHFLTGRRLLYSSLAIAGSLLGAMMAMLAAASGSWRRATSPTTRVLSNVRGTSTLVIISMGLVIVQMFLALGRLTVTSKSYASTATSTGRLEVTS
jgi:hypothetical protein